MPTTSQMLRDYPDIMFQVLAELRGAMTDVAETREQLLELLAAQMTDPTSVQMVYEDVGYDAPESHKAIELLLKEGGEIAEAQFSRQFGAIRQMGPAKLEREMPWVAPQSVAEMLYYNGLIGRAFRGAGQAAHPVIFLPTDVVPWLPHPQNQVAEGGLPVQPVAPPPTARVIAGDDSFLDDMGTLLGFLYTERLRVTDAGPHPEDIDLFVRRLQMPFSGDLPELNVRLGLILHLANRLGWLRRGENETIQLTVNPVSRFLEMTRAEQRRAVWDAWFNSAEWNDLCRIPGLECAETGNWRNDPLQTRARIVHLLAQIQAGAWYSRTQVIEAIRTVEPDFQRPTGDYDSWYIRDVNSQEFLRGFAHWDDVEGALVRFLVAGPLHWLRFADLAEPSAGDDMLFSVTQWGSFWLGQETPQPHEPPHPGISVEEDFTIHVPHGVSLFDRFRVERFAGWQASYPEYVYQINQRSLKRALEQKIPAARILEFLKQRAPTVPPRVENALLRFGNTEKVGQ
ncbi:MAG: hypothetical protein WDZ49_10115 [Litorilinea sp.]